MVNVVKDFVPPLRTLSSVFTRTRTGPSGTRVPFQEPFHKREQEGQRNPGTQSDYRV